MGFPRSFSRKIMAVAVGVPIAGVGGLSAYVQYRQSTRPPRFTIQPNVDAAGNLVLEGKIIPRPSAVSICVRVVELAVLFLPLAFLYVFMSLRDDWYQAWINLLLRAVQAGGPVFVKIGQWSCTREDIFPKEFRRVFKKLYNEVGVHPYEDTLRILGEELGKDPLEVFKSIEPTTVGSGSIGQVHVAHLKNDHRVVVKVMHPGIIETIVRDFAILNALASFIHRAMPSMERHNLPELSRAFTSHLASQLDFRIEAENLERFRENFGRSQYVNFPEPLMSTQRMLVETFCEGVPANPEFLASLPDHARDVLATKGLNTWCQMLLRDNFIHGDMHPGNILIDCSDLHAPNVTLIDVGLCQQLSPVEAVVTHDLMESFVRWNARQCADSLWNMADTQKYADKDKFYGDMENIFGRFRSSKNDKNAVTNVLQGIFDCIRVNHVQMDPPYVSLLFAVLVLEAFIMNLNPEFNMVRQTAPWLVSEGHVSKGVLKNLVKTKFDSLKREYGIVTGRMEDSMVLENLEENKNVRMSGSSW